MAPGNSYGAINTHCNNGSMGYFLFESHWLAFDQNPCEQTWLQRASCSCNRRVGLSTKRMSMAYVRSPSSTRETLHSSLDFSHHQQPPLVPHARSTPVSQSVSTLTADRCKWDGSNVWFRKTIFTNNIATCT